MLQYGEMFSRTTLLTNSCSTLPKNLVAIITLGHERIYASLNISYQAPHHLGAFRVLEFPGLFLSLRLAGLGRNRGLSLYHPVLCLDPKICIPWMPNSIFIATLALLQLTLA